MQSIKADKGPNQQLEMYIKVVSSITITADGPSWL